MKKKTKIEMSILMRMHQVMRMKIQVKKKMKMEMSLLMRIHMKMKKKMRMSMWMQMRSKGGRYDEDAISIFCGDHTCCP